MVRGDCGDEIVRPSKWGVDPDDIYGIAVEELQQLFVGCAGHDKLNDAQKVRRSSAVSALR